MMNRRSPARLALSACALASLCLTSCLPPGGAGALLQPGPGALPVKPAPNVMSLARDLDHLEKHIECYGSIVTKQPDVWGQARLTKHREEYEKEMAAQLDDFTETLQGALARSDQAYFSNALALSNAAAGKAAGTGAGGLVAGRRVVVNASSGAATATAPTAPTDVVVDDAPVTLDRRAPIAIKATSFRQFAEGDKGKGLQLEPTVSLDQRSRYINHLHELRRINEGDDTADSPGYALNLVRIPVSVLPGSHTRQGYGAEVTMTMQPYLSDELLPTTFRNLVLNDLVDQLGVPLTLAINDKEVRDLLLSPAQEYLVRNEGEEANIAVLRSSDEIEGYLNTPNVAAYLRQADVAPGEFRRAFYALFIDTKTGKPAEPPTVNTTAHARAELKYQLAAKSTASQYTAQLGRLRGLSIPATKLRRARLPYPPSQVTPVNGRAQAFHIAKVALEVFLMDKASQPCACEGDRKVFHLPDIQGWLSEEIAAAHKLLAQPCHEELWRFASPELAHAIRSRQDDVIEAARNAFFAALTEIAHRDARYTTFGPLAWAIIVESALLNEQLVGDMKEVASLRGCGCACRGDAWLPYFLPNPPAEARQSFNEYVRCRWPIHVFALDPAAQQQNIADVFSRRRELQMSLSLAFVTGQISARNMTRYARRIEHDFETIDLNNTAVGFSHGNETFGWRFYPRFQTPDVESNATVLFRDLLLGGPRRDADLRQRRLEPGPRECVAVVIMPSFVPYATLNVNTKWFKLTNPKKAEPDLTDAMRLSKAAKAIEVCAAGVTDADCYRNGDFEHLRAKAKQLEARLPMQSTVVQIPYENTLGGFAMFNTGVTDLAPQLTGWYGAPGVRLAAPTTMFLVGNHFSVHQTRVIAGGLECTTRELLSRQVMKVVIPPGADTVGKGSERFVEVYVATPYGVTPHILVPVCEKVDCPGGAVSAPPPAVKGGLTWNVDGYEASFIYSGLGIAPSRAPAGRPVALRLKVGPDLPVGVAKSAELRLTFAPPYNSVSLPLRLVAAYDGSGALAFSVGSLGAELAKAFEIVFGPEGVKPPQSLKARAVVKWFDKDDKPLQQDGKDLETTSADTLAITWVKAPR